MMELRAVGVSEKPPKEYEDARKGRTYVFCAYCGRIISAYSAAGRAMRHRLDKHPDYDYGGRFEGAVEINTDCPGEREYGEIVEGEIYQSPIDSLKWVRVQ